MKPALPYGEIQRLAKALVSYADDPVAFVRRILGAEPDPWQQEALEALAAGENVAIRSGHGVGKSALLAWVVLWFLSTRPWPKLPCTAPTQHQLFDILWSEISYWLNRSKLKDIITWTGTRVGMLGVEEVWFAAARTANKPENLAGFHSKHLLYIVDEASGMEDAIMMAVDGALTTQHAQVILTGNPTRRQGYFYDAFHRSKRLWHRIHVSSEDSPRVSQRYCKEMARKWGRKSDVYRVRVLGKFPKQDEATFIASALVQKSMNLWHEKTVDTEWIEMGVDVARYGRDETVFVIRQGPKVIKLLPKHGYGVDETAGKAIKLIKKYGIDRVKVDDTGVGGGVTDLLMSACEEGTISDCEIVPVNFGGEGDDSYLRTDGIMWGNVKDLLREGRIWLKPDDALLDELTSRKFKLTGKGKIQLESKDDLKKRGLPSPGRADSTVLAFYGDDLMWEPSSIRTSGTKREGFKTDTIDRQSKRDAEKEKDSRQKKTRQDRIAA